MDLNYELEEGCTRDKYQNHNNINKIKNKEKCFPISLEEIKIVTLINHLIN